MAGHSSQSTSSLQSLAFTFQLASILPPPFLLLCLSNTAPAPLHTLCLPACLPTYLPYSPPVNSSSNHPSAYTPFDCPPPLRPWSRPLYLYVSVFVRRGTSRRCITRRTSSHMCWTYVNWRRRPGTGTTPRPRSYRSYKSYRFKWSNSNSQRSVRLTQVEVFRCNDEFRQSSQLACWFC